MDSDNDRGATQEQVSIEKTIGDLISGPPKNLRDPRLFHSLSLIAFLAWVGLGSDGLSSSCYGPEEAFLALGHASVPRSVPRPDDGDHRVRHRGVVLADHRSVSQRRRRLPGRDHACSVRIRASFPAAALVVDYVLTISISIASGADAIFSFLPTPWLRWKLLRMPVRRACDGRDEPARGEGIGDVPAADLSRLRADACVV